MEEILDLDYEFRKMMGMSIEPIQTGNLDLDNEIYSFFGAKYGRIEDLIRDRDGEIKSGKLCRFIIQNNLFDNIKGKIRLSLPSIEDLTQDELELLIQKLDIEEILLSDLKGLTKEKLQKMEGRCGIEGDLLGGYAKGYDVETLSEILDVMEEIKNSIPENATELEKFLRVYKAIGMSTNYDHSGCIGDELETKEEIDLARSLKGVLLEGRAVCVGYSLALQYALQYVGIEAKKVSGHAYLETEDGEHAWNQVKIDGCWYNADLTWDYRNLREGVELGYCLKSDEEFSKEHVADELSNCEKCEVDYSKDEVQTTLASIHCELDEYKENLGKGYKRLISKSDFKEVAESTIIEPQINSDISRLVNDRGDRENQR